MAGGSVSWAEGNVHQLPNVRDRRRSRPTAPGIGRPGEMGLVLPQAAGGLPGKAELSGLEFRFGQTGIAALGDGTLYFSQDGSHPEEKTFYTTLVHYKRQDDPNTPFLELA